MHKTVYQQIVQWWGEDIFNHDLYAFYEPIKENNDFHVMAKEYGDMNKIIDFARAKILETGKRYSIESVHTNDDEDIYIVFEDDFWD